MVAATQAKITSACHQSENVPTAMRVPECGIVNPFSGLRSYSPSRLVCDADTHQTSPHPWGGLSSERQAPVSSQIKDQNDCARVNRGVSAAARTEPTRAIQRPPSDKPPWWRRLAALSSAKSTIGDIVECTQRGRVSGDSACARRDARYTKRALYQRSIKWNSNAQNAAPKTRANNQTARAPAERRVNSG